jgi:hypothetical protein
MALKSMEGMLRLRGDRGLDLLESYFGEEVE